LQDSVVVEEAAAAVRAQGPGVEGRVVAKAEAVVQPVWLTLEPETATEG
jgi:hypothetical protein